MPASSEPMYPAPPVMRTWDLSNGAPLSNREIQVVTVPGGLIVVTTTLPSGRRSAHANGLRELAHQLVARSIVHLPERRHHRRGPRVEERPLKFHQLVRNASGRCPPLRRDTIPQILGE